MNRYLTLVALLTGLLMLSACRGDDTGDASTSGGEGDAWTDIVWQWTTLTENGPDGQTVTEVPDPESYTIVFREDGTFTGQADCNQVAGEYSAESGFSLTLGPTTTAFCGEDSLDQQYLDLLGRVAAGGPDGAGGFALETAGGAERMSFQDGGAAPAE